MKIKYTVRAYPYLKNGGEEKTGEIEIDVDDILTRIIRDKIQGENPGFGLKDFSVVEDEE